METLAKGKLSYYVLSCLSERDMYGLELIEQIKLKFGVDIKLPSLYSNLNRMKELKFVSNYLKESTKGPKCSYSSITEKGRNELEALKLTWENSDTTLSQTKEETKNEPVIEKKLDIHENIKKEEFLEEVKEDDKDDYEDYFSLPDEETEFSETIDEQDDDEIEEAFVEEKIEDVESDTFIDSIIDNPTYIEETIEEEVVEQQTLNEEVLENTNPALSDIVIEEFKEEIDQENSKQLDAKSYSENKKLFDITQDFSKYRKKKSFTENQIVMNVNTSAPKDEETKSNDITTIKQTLENSKDGNYEPIDRFSQKDESEAPKVLELTNEYEKFNKETKDDGLFITDRIPVDEIPKAKKIEMSKLSFKVPTDVSKLPAPNRDSSLDPTHSDIQQRLQKLYEKTTATNDTQIKYREYETFEDLKDYYDTQDIDFKVYNKPETKLRHNTNKLLFFVEMILFGFVGVCSGILYWIFSSISAVNQDLSFLYYLFPIIGFVFLIYKFYNYKFGVSRLPKSMLNPLIMWLIFLLGSVAIFCFSLICGLSLTNPVTYYTCIIYPIIVLGVWLAARYYLTLHFYKKFWR